MNLDCGGQKFCVLNQPVATMVHVTHYLLDPLLGHLISRILFKSRLQFSKAYHTSLICIDLLESFSEMRNFRFIEHLYQYIHGLPF